MNTVQDVLAAIAATDPDFRVEPEQDVRRKNDQVRQILVDPNHLHLKIGEIKIVSALILSHAGWPAFIEQWEADQKQFHGHRLHGEGYDPSEARLARPTEDHSLKHHKKWEAQQKHVPLDNAAGFKACLEKLLKTPCSLATIARGKRELPPRPAPPPAPASEPTGEPAAATPPAA